MACDDTEQKENDDVMTPPRMQVTSSSGTPPRHEPSLRAKPSASWCQGSGDPFGQPFDEYKTEVRQRSRYKGDWKRWDLVKVIYKSGDDLRQEVLAMQLIVLMDDILKKAKLPIQLVSYTIVVMSHDSGILECVPNAKDIDGLKKGFVERGFGSDYTLAKFFEDYFGKRGTARFRAARKNFIETMVGYSLYQYLFQLKDRHNGNIMLDRNGRVIHIDFGFLLSNSPGGNINFESSPFKLSQEFLEVLGGERSESGDMSEGFALFRGLMINGFMELRKHRERFIDICEIMIRGSPMGCFYGGPGTIDLLRARFMPGESDVSVVERMVELIEEATCNWRTRQYDDYQYRTNGIL